MPSETLTIGLDAGDEPTNSTEVAQSIRWLHDRMPVIIAPGDFAEWLAATTSAGELQGSPARTGASDLSAYPVSLRANNVWNDDRALIEDGVEATSR